MPNELKPCPFCGGTNVVALQCHAPHVLKKYHGGYYAGCRDCRITTQIYTWRKTGCPLCNRDNMDNAKEKAIRDWNRRADNDL